MNFKIALIRGDGSGLVAAPSQKLSSFVGAKPKCPLGEMIRRVSLLIVLFLQYKMFITLVITSTYRVSIALYNWFVNKLQENISCNIRKKMLLL